MRSFCPFNALPVEVLTVQQRAQSTQHGTRYEKDVVVALATALNNVEYARMLDLLQLRSLAPTKFRDELFAFALLVHEQRHPSSGRSVEAGHQRPRPGQQSAGTAAGIRLRLGLVRPDCCLPLEGPRVGRRQRAQ